MTAPKPDHLDEPRATPDYEAADDVSEWAVTHREQLEGMLVVECPQATREQA